MGAKTGKGMLLCMLYSVVHYESIKARAKDKTYMSVGAMKD
jgi:hypothetical protein